MGQAQNMMLRFLSLHKYIIWVAWVQWFTNTNPVIYKYKCCEDAFANPWWCELDMEENQNISPPVIHLCVDDTINTCATWVDWVNWFYKASSCEDAYANSWFLGTTVCMEENQNISPPVIHVSCSCRWSHLMTSYLCYIPYTVASWPRFITEWLEIFRCDQSFVSLPLEKLISEFFIMFSAPSFSLCGYIP
jgi:hypothetical protein